jgi:hypothetical protein
MSDLPSNPDSPVAERGVLCAKCDHLNPPGSKVCEECGARLFVACHYCGHKNRRVDAACAQCGHHLHRSVWRRWQRKILGQNVKLLVIEAILFVILVVIGFKLIIHFVESPAASGF